MEAGLAKGLALFQLSLVSYPDDVHLEWPAEVDPEHVLDPFMPVLSTSGEAEPARHREILLEDVRTTAAQG